MIEHHYDPFVLGFECFDLTIDLLMKIFYWIHSDRLSLMSPEHQILWTIDRGVGPFDSFHKEAYHRTE